MKLRKEGSELLRRFEEFIIGISKIDRVAIIHHTDPDGVCSGVIATKLVERMRNKKINLRHNQKSSEHKITKETFDLLKKNKITKIIITDISPDEDPSIIKKIEKFAKILILDHHKIYNNINSENTVMLKPNMIFENVEPSNYCSAKFVFDLGSNICDLSDLDWLATAGVIGDCTTKVWKPFLNKTFKKYNLKENEDYFKTKLGQIAVFLSSSEAFSENNIEFNFKTTYNAKSFDDILNNKKLKHFAKEIQTEFEYWIKNINKLAEIKPKLDLIFYFLKPKYNIKSPISTILAEKFPEKTLITLAKKNDFVFFSGRRKDFKIPMNEVFENAIKGIKNASAGGHIPAAGGRVPIKDFSLFKKRVFDQLKSKMQSI